MNLLGKLFIVLIFIGSILLAGFSVSLYATHKNWKQQSDTLTADLKKKEDELKTLRQLKTDMESALQLEISRQANAIIALTDTVDNLKEDNAEAKDDLAKLQAMHAEEVEATKTAGENVEKLRKELEGERAALVKAQSEWVAMSTDLVKKMDEAQSLAIQVTNYQSIGAQLAKDYRDAMEVLRMFGLQANPALYAKHPPAGIKGTVTEVRERGMIEISIGSDSGLVKGHQLDVVRYREGRSVYVGKVEITTTAADRAVAQVMPEFRRGTVQRGDEVTYIEIELVAH